MRSATAQSDSQSGNLAGKYLTDSRRQPHRLKIGVGGNWLPFVVIT
jgi:hypothetical protein